MPEKIIAGNWKMNLKINDALNLVKGITAQVGQVEGMKVVFFPSFPFIYTVSELLDSYPNIFVGGQNLSNHDSGAYTGEVSASMLTSVGSTYVLIGHSERREYFAEDDALLLKKMETALRAGLKPIFCCGEPQQQREQGLHASYVTRQIEEVLFKLTEDQLSEIVIAYEPIWAIGTGLTATPEQAQEMHALIRHVLDIKFDKSIVHDLSILYGGSVNDNNAEELFSQPDINGGLVGGASLKEQQFVSIINAMKNL